MTYTNYGVRYNNGIYRWLQTYDQAIAWQKVMGGTLVKAEANSDTLQIEISEV